MAKKYIVKIGGKEAEVEFKSDEEAMNYAVNEALAAGLELNKSPYEKVKEVHWTVSRVEENGDKTVVGYGSETGNPFF